MDNQVCAQIYSSRREINQARWDKKIKFKNK